MLTLNHVSELACRDESRQAPFEKITSNPSDFIDAEYMPTGISFKDPRSMKLESLVNFFKHISQRESSHGITQGFRFSAVLSSRKKGSLRPARYKEDGDDFERDENTPVPTRRRRRKPQQVEPDLTLLSSDITPTGLLTPEKTPAPGPSDPMLPAKTIKGPKPKTTRRSVIVTPVGSSAEETPVPKPRRSKRTATKGSAPSKKKKKGRKN